MRRGEKLNLGQYFEVGLLVATVASGAVALVDVLFFAKARKARVAAKLDLSKLKKKERHEALRAPLLADYARSLFPVFLLVFLLRSFVAEPYRIPSGSMLPSLQIGDFILVNKYDYGLKWPVWGGAIFKVGKPKRGDIVVLHFPVDSRVDLIKRVIGVPGDRISYQDGVLTINGKVMPQKFLRHSIIPADSSSQVVNISEENLSGVKHEIIAMPWAHSYNFKNVVVPKGKYFVMGDNRNNSEDSRYWGFASAKDLVGRAFMVWFSWDSHTDSVRWSRIGRKI